MSKRVCKEKRRVFWRYGKGVEEKMRWQSKKSKTANEREREREERMSSRKRGLASKEREEVMLNK